MWTEPLVRGKHRLVAVPLVWGSLVRRSGRLTALCQHVATLAAEASKCRCVWQELEIRQTHNSTQLQSGLYLSNLLAIAPDAVGHPVLCPRLAMLQSSGGPRDARASMLRLQTGVPAGKSRDVRESGQEVPRAHRARGSWLWGLWGALTGASPPPRHPALLPQQTVTVASWVPGGGCCAPEASFSLVRIFV